MAPESASSDRAWSSRGLRSKDALKQWQAWASQALAPMLIDVADETHFAAHWASKLVGDLELNRLGATPQQVRHGDIAMAEPSFQLVCAIKSPMFIRVASKDLCIDEGEFVLLDNSRAYVARMDAPHEAIDLVMPARWLERWLPNPLQYTARPYSASTKWGLPLGSYLSAMASELNEAALPRSIIADQVGTLLALAVRAPAAEFTTHKAKLLQRILRLIEERSGEPALNPNDIAQELGISKRYLHALLAEGGTTFLGTLGRIRLDRAGELLADRRLGRCQIAEIAAMCGYLDPGYFARAFKRRYGATPRNWRAARLG
jgi:AraC-like DNA-binding protein